LPNNFSLSLTSNAKWQVPMFLVLSAEACSRPKRTLTILLDTFSQVNFPMLLEKTARRIEPTTSRSRSNFPNH